MQQKGRKELRTTRRWLLHLGSIAMASAFVRQPSLVTKTRRLQPHNNPHDSVMIVPRRNHLATVRSSVDSNAEFDALLEEPSNFAKAIRFLRSNPDNIDLSRDRFGKIFDAIEARTSDSESIPDQEQQVVSEARKEMSEMYSLLKEQGHLKLFGSINKENMPANGSHTVRPSMLETITSLSMSSLLPCSDNNRG